MTAPSFVNSGAIAASGGATSRTPKLPGNRVNGNLLIAVCRSSGAPTHSWSGNGWTKLDQVDVSDSTAVSLAWCVVDGSEGQPVCSWTGNQSCGAIVYQFTGTDGNTPFNGAHLSNTGNTSPHTNAGVTTLGTDSLAIYIDGTSASIALSQPIGWTEHSDQGMIVADTRLAMGSKVVSGSGNPSGAISVTGANTDWVMWQIELLSPSV